MGKKEYFNVSSSYKVIDILGRGGYGVVCSAIHKSSGTMVAIKKINPFGNSLVCIRTIREILLLKKLQDHENIVTLYMIQRPIDIGHFNEVYLIQEYMPTDLSKLLSQQTLSCDHIQYFTYQILRGLKYIHLAGVIHRDLKPSNLLVNSNCDLKICDLGLARFADSSLERIDNMTEYVATRWYRAPEVMLLSSQYLKAMDLWSVGCILGEMIAGYPLFPGKDYYNQLILIMQLLGNPCNDIDDMKLYRWSRSKKFLHSLKQYVRLDFYKIFLNTPNRQLKHLAIDPQCIDLLQQLLVFNPNKRISVEDALRHPYLSLYYDKDDEPTTEPISETEFDFDKHKTTLSMQELKLKLYHTVCEFRQ